MFTRQRLDSAKRILDVEQQLRRAAEMKLGELQRREVENASRQRDLLASLNADTPPHPALAGAMAAQLGHLSVEAEQIAREKEAQERLVLQRHGRERRAGRLADALQRTEEQTLEKHQLQEAIDGHTRASLP